MKLIKNPPSKEVERQLIPRLRVLGLALMGFGLLSFLYALVSSPYVPLPREEGMDSPEESESASGIYLAEAPFFSLTEGDRTRFYGAALTFSIIGLTCILIARKRQFHFKE